MSESGEIQGFVNTVDRRPVEGAVAFILDGPAHPDVAAVTDAQGQFRFSDLAPGAYVVSVSAEGSEPVHELVQVESGRSSRTDVLLQNNVEGEIGSEDGPYRTIRSSGGRRGESPAKARPRGPSGRNRPQPDDGATSKSPKELADTGGDIALQPSTLGGSWPNDLPSGTYRIKLDDPRIGVTLLRRYNRVFLDVKVLKPGEPVPRHAVRDMEGPSKLQRGRWFLESYGDNLVLEGTAVTADFNASRLTGNAGCNDYDGSYEATGDSLVVGDFSVTEMFCDQPEGILEQESAYLALLKKASSSK